MTQVFAGVLVVAFAVVGNATELKVLEDCKVTKVNDENVFEESLSVDEYPEVSVLRDQAGEFVVNVGAMNPWVQAKGDIVSLKDGFFTGRRVEFQGKESNKKYVLKFFTYAHHIGGGSKGGGIVRYTRRGTLSRFNQSGKLDKIAELLCRR